MSHAEDQAMELEALASIYGDAYRAGGADAEGPTAFALLLEPELEGGPKVNHVAVWLHASFPPDYPDVPPAARLSVERGLSIEQVTELRAEMAKAIEENAGGGPCMYAVAERLREWLQAHNEPAGSGSAYEEMLKRQKKAAEGDKAGAPSGPVAYSRHDDPSIQRKVVVSASEEDEALRRKREGTPVTREGFEAWAAAFDAEMEILRAKEEAEGVTSNGVRFWGVRPVKGRLTGRQMFEADASLAFSDVAALDAEDRGGATPGGADGAAGAAAGAAGAIDASLFDGDDLDGLDLGDSDDDEDDEDYEDDEEDDDDEEEDDDDDDDEDDDAPSAKGPAPAATSGGGGGRGGGGKGGKR